MGDGGAAAPIRSPARLRLTWAKQSDMHKSDWIPKQGQTKLSSWTIVTRNCSPGLANPLTSFTEIHARWSRRALSLANATPFSAALAAAVAALVDFIISLSCQAYITTPIAAMMAIRLGATDCGIFVSFAINGFEVVGESDWWKENDWNQNAQEKAGGHAQAWSDQAK
jgi:hypothetical protein